MFQKKKLVHETDSETQKLWALKVMKKIDFFPFADQQIQKKNLQCWKKSKLPSMNWTHNDVAGRSKDASSMRILIFKHSDAMMSSTSWAWSFKRFERSKTPKWELHLQPKREQHRQVQKNSTLGRAHKSKIEAVGNPSQNRKSKIEFFFRSQRSTMTLFDEVKHEMCFVHSGRESCSVFNKIPNRNRFTEEGTGE